jgi:hypothetical protein
VQQDRHVEKVKTTFIEGVFDLRDVALAVPIFGMSELPGNSMTQLVKVRALPSTVEDRINYDLGTDGASVQDGAAGMIRFGPRHALAFEI